MVKSKLRKNRRKNRTAKMQKGGGFFDDLKDKAGNLFSFLSGKTMEGASNTIKNAKERAECIKICMGKSEISSNLDSTKKTETNNLTKDNNEDVKSDNRAVALGGSKKRRRKSKKKKKGRKKRRKTRHR